MEVRPLSFSGCVDSSASRVTLRFPKSQVNEAQRRVAALSGATSNPFVSIDKLHGYQWAQTEDEVQIYTQVRGELRMDYLSDGFVCEITADNVRCVCLLWGWASSFLVCPSLLDWSRPLFAQLSTCHRWTLRDR